MSDAMVTTDIEDQPKDGADTEDKDLPACCRHKHTPRSEKMQHDLICRLNRAIGQLNGVKTMIEDNRYCGDVLTQLAAAQSAVKSVSRIVLQNHLETCVVEKIQNGDTEVVDELMQLIKKFTD